MTAERYLFAGLIVWLALRSCAAHAQDDAIVLDVVRLTAHEAGVDSPADADGIYAAIVNGAAAHGLTPHAYARAHSRRFFRGTSARPWALALGLDCDRPAGFPARWSRYRPACLALVAHVRAIVGSPPVCLAETWGDARDHERARARGVCLRIVSCAPGARNLFSLPCGRAE